MPTGESRLHEAVERLHNCSASFMEVVPVVETFQGQTVWEGMVHVFDLQGHPTAKRCYAWASVIDDGPKQRVYAVLHQPPIDSPAAAVRAAIVRDHRDIERF